MMSFRSREITARLSSLACAVAALTVVVIGAVCPPAQADLLLALETPKQEYLVQEPLLVVVRVSNAGTTNARIVRYLDPSEGLLEVEVTAPGEKAHSYRPWVHLTALAGAFANSGVELGPGEEYSAVADLTYEVGRRALLSRSGEYLSLIHI